MTQNHRQDQRVRGSVRVSVTERVGRVSSESIYGPALRNVPNTKVAPRLSVPGRDAHAKKVGKTKLRYTSPADAYAAVARKLAELNGEVSVTETESPPIPRELPCLPSAVTSIIDGRDVRIVGTVPKGNEYIAPECHQSLTGSTVEPARVASVERTSSDMRHHVAVDWDTHHACMVSGSAFRDGRPAQRRAMGSIRSTVKLGDGKG